jgi:hypothetical protein
MSFPDVFSIATLAYMSILSSVSFQAKTLVLREDSHAGVLKQFLRRDGERKFRSAAILEEYGNSGSSPRKNRRDQKAQRLQRQSKDTEQCPRPGTKAAIL